MKKRSDSALFLAFAACFLFRLLPFRPPNVEPLLATGMPVGKAYGRGIGFLFGVLSIVLFDAVTGRLGIWTPVSAIAYGTIGYLASRILGSGRSSVRSYVVFAAISTILYDALTGLTLGPIFFGQPFSAALMGQIPFTLLHLAGNVAFAATLSPAIHYALTRFGAAPITRTHLKHA